MTDKYAFEALIVNTEKYGELGSEAGTWLTFPTDAETVKAAFRKINLPDNPDRADYFFEKYDSNITDISQRLGYDEDINALNYLASLIMDFNDSELSEFNILLEMGEHDSGAEDMINLASNLDSYSVMPDMSIASIGAYYAQLDGFSGGTSGKLADFMNYKEYGEYCLSTKDNLMYDGDVLVEFNREFYKDIFEKEGIPEKYCVVEKPDQYRIYQLKSDDALRDCRFVSLSALEKQNMKVDPDNYELVYSAKLPHEMTLEDIYTKFNMDRPHDFTGHSLSVSDVVVLNKGGKETAYYCDTIGFAELPEFIKPENYLETAEKSTEQNYDMIDETINNEPPETMTVLVVEPAREPYTKEIGADLKSMQDLVGGNIETLYPFDDEACLICNEEGKNERLELNRALYDADGEMYDIIAGTFFIAGLGDESFASVSSEQIKTYSERFRSPEIFINANGKITAVPVKPSIKENLKKLSSERPKAAKEQPKKQRKPPDIEL